MKNSPLHVQFLLKTLSLSSMISTVWAGILNRKRRKKNRNDDKDEEEEEEEEEERIWK